jgi:hypothetical protein
LGVGAIPWSPLARGLLTRPYGNDSTVMLRSQTDMYEDQSWFAFSLNFFSFFSSDRSKATVRMQEQKKLSTRKLLVFYASIDKILIIIYNSEKKIALRRLPKLRVLAWRNFRLHGS